MKSKFIRFNETSEISKTKGIFSYMQEKADVINLHEKGIISITTNDPGRNSKPLHIIDKNTSTYWNTANNTNAYLLIDFKKNKVIVEDYWVNNRGFDFSQEWKMLGSNDKVRWTLISNEKTNYEQSNGKNYWLKFHSLSLMRFRYIKVVQLKPRAHVNGAHLTFYDLELFGMFCSHEDLINDMKTCAIRRQNCFAMLSVCLCALLS